MNNYRTNHGQSSDMKLVDVTNENVLDYKGFEACFSELSQFLSRIYPDSDKTAKWCYINVDDKNIGSIWLETVDSSAAKLGIFIVDEEYRGKGYGTEAIKRLLSFAENNGYKNVLLNVRISNKRAFNVYSKLGFNEVKRYIKDNGVKVISMKKELSI